MSEKPTNDLVAKQAGQTPARPDGRPQLPVVETRRGLFGVRGSGDTTGFGGLVRDVRIGEPSEPPYGSWFDEAIEVLRELLTTDGLDPDAVIQAVVVDRGELTVHIAREHLPRVCQHLRDDQDLRFELCLGVSGVHYPDLEGAELHAVYHLLSITHGGRLIRLEVSCSIEDPHIPSIVETYPANDWHERETWDFFGIVFDGHPSLARSHMPDDWVGHPQRKDYPLGGIPVEYKGATVPPADTRRSYN
ncbi:MAG: NADH-quinone oxidoreductase subunit C [Bowdeniella nasicola]|nr:NADH-quinone oxidoreductase subunit C [Bowdeniella nasicola]